MKNFFPLKFLVIVYSLLFLVPLFFIFWLPNSPIMVVIKVLLGLWMIFTFFQSSQRCQHITLGPFLCFVGLFFTLWWFLQTSPFSYLFSLLFIIWFFGKFRQIDKIHEEADQSIKQNMFNFIHKAAVKSYKREIEDLINAYSRLDKEQLADYLIMSVWTRAGMQNEGLFKYPDGTKNNFPYLSAYPIMMSEFEKIIKAFRKQGLNTEAVAMSIWVHSLRGLLYNSEMKNEFDKLWQLLMTTKNLWDKYLTKFYSEDKNRLDPKMLDETMKLSKEILNNLPPKQSYEHNN